MFGSISFDSDLAWKYVNYCVQLLCSPYTQGEINELAVLLNVCSFCWRVIYSTAWGPATALIFKCCATSRSEISRLSEQQHEYTLYLGLTRFFVMRKGRAIARLIWDVTCLTSNSLDQRTCIILVPNCQCGTQRHLNVGQVTCIHGS